MSAPSIQVQNHYEIQVSYHAAYMIEVEELPFSPLSFMICDVECINTEISGCLLNGHGLPSCSVKLIT